MPWSWLSSQGIDNLYRTPQFAEATARALDGFLRWQQVSNALTRTVLTGLTKRRDYRRRTRLGHSKPKFAHSGRSDCSPGSSRAHRGISKGRASCYSSQTRGSVVRLPALTETEEGPRFLFFSTRISSNNSDMAQDRTHRRLTQTEAAFLYTEKPHAPMHIGGL